MAANKRNSTANKGQAAEKKSAPAQSTLSSGAAADSADAVKDASVPEQDAPSISADVQSLSPYDGEKALFIRSRPKSGFRRCGLFFTPEGSGVVLDILSDEDIQTLKDEPNLVVEEVTLESVLESAN